MPTLSRSVRWVPAGLLVLLLIAPFVLPIPTVLAKMLALRKAGELAHVFLPLVLTLVLAHRGPLAGRITAAALAALLLTASCDLVQEFVGRSARIQDVLYDLDGVGIAWGWLIWRRTRRAPALLLALLLALLVPWHLRPLPAVLRAEAAARAGFPVLGAFETDFEMALWSRNEGDAGAMSVVSDGNPGRALRISGEPGDYYPGAILRGAPGDWSGYRTLSFDARTVAGGRAEVGVRLDDFASRFDGAWSGTTFRVGPEWTRCEVDLARAAAAVEHRQFRLDDIDSLLLYLGRLREPTGILLDNIELR